MLNLDLRNKENKIPCAKAGSCWEGEAEFIIYKKKKKKKINEILHQLKVANMGSSDWKYMLYCNNINYGSKL